MPHCLLGASGIATIFTCLMTLVANGSLSMMAAIGLASTSPARILGIAGGSLETGTAADVICFDADAATLIDQNRFVSRSRISPFHGQPEQGHLSYSFVNGQLVHQANK